MVSRFSRVLVQAVLLASMFLALSMLPGCATSPGAEYPAELRTRYEAPERLIAIGDVHGDIDAVRAALRKAGALGDGDRWTGGNLVVVQTGDVLDRGDDEEAIIDLLESLDREARREGGAVHALNGNHELMNAYLDFRYVTPGGFSDFEGLATVDPADSVLAALEPEQRLRAAVFRPGGPMALRMARRNTAVIVGESLFVHGGILPEHVEWGLDEMNEAVRAWLRGEIPQPEWIRGDLSPVWTRLYSSEPDAAACDTLAGVLDGLDVQRMVVGHTVQSTGITSFCGGRVWAIDVGMASHYGGRTEVLEIRGGVVRSLW
jgi:hypothetical protein